MTLTQKGTRAAAATSEEFLQSDHEIVASGKEVEVNDRMGVLSSPVENYIRNFRKSVGSWRIGRFLHYCYTGCYIIRWMAVGLELATN